MKKNKIIISNPEELEKNLQYTSPLTWIIIGVVVCLIGGLFAWSCLYKIKDRIIGKALISGGEVSLVVDNSSLSKLKVGQKVYICELEGEIVDFVDKKPVVSDFDLVDGEYEYTIVREVKPIEYIVS